MFSFFEGWNGLAGMDFGNAVTLALFLGAALWAAIGFAHGLNPMAAAGRKAVIYARYSSDKQRDASIEDQVRNVRNHLDKLGIPHDDAVILSDSGISGEREDRENYQKAREMIVSNQVSVLACDEQSRLTRGPEMSVVLNEMDLHGCRFVTANGYDSQHDQNGFMAVLKGQMNLAANREHGHRVRRGIAGRVMDGNGSDGSHPFGYSSRYCDPAEAERYMNGGPRPKKEVFINEAEAKIVREVFKTYVDGMSMSEIARELNRRDVTPGHQSRRRNADGKPCHNGWHKTLVHNLLTQEKYIGTWIWGAYRHRKDPLGKLIVTPADPRDVVRSQRSDLAIVPMELWNAVRERLARNREKYGFKEGQKRRGSKAHYTEDYPNTILAGLLFCGVCGKQLEYVPRGEKSYYHCPIARREGKFKGQVACNLAGWVRYERALEALLDYLKADLGNSRGWLELVYEKAVAAYESLTAALPDELSNLEKRQGEVAGAIGRLVDMVERGQGGDALATRLREREAERVAIEEELRRLRDDGRRRDSLPTLEDTRRELDNLAGVLGDEIRGTARWFRKYFGRIRVLVEVAPGKIRGHAELVFQPNRLGLVEQALGLGSAPARNGTAAGNSLAGGEVRLVLAGNDKLDKLMPAIDAMRQAGKSWKHIASELKIGTNWPLRYYKKWKSLTTREAGSQGDMPVNQPLVEAV